MCSRIERHLGSTPVTTGRDTDAEHRVEHSACARVARLLVSSRSGPAPGRLDGGGGGPASPMADARSPSLRGAARTTVERRCVNAEAAPVARVGVSWCALPLPYRMQAAPKSNLHDLAHNNRHTYTH